MMSGEANLTEVYFHRRRLLSNRDLADLELDAQSLALTGVYQQPGAIGSVDESDEIRAISELESRCYQGNMLLRDSDIMGMAHGLEIRVPFLDRRLLDQEACGDTRGEVRFAARSGGQESAAHCFCRAYCAPALTNRPKTGFTLPLANGCSARCCDLCERSLQACAEQGGLPVAAISRVWKRFFSEPTGPQASRALSLVVLGDFLQRIGPGQPSGD